MKVELKDVDRGELSMFLEQIIDELSLTDEQIEKLERICSLGGYYGLQARMWKDKYSTYVVFDN